MRFKATFLAGLAVGFVAGARAGRERYEQMVKAGRKVAENPTVQKATQTASAKATELTKVAKDKAAQRMPKVTETAKTSATKMRGQLDRLPGRHAAQPAAAVQPGAAAQPAAGTESAPVNGTRPAD
jgi:hypothetical protein